MVRDTRFCVVHPDTLQLDDNAGAEQRDTTTTQPDALHCLACLGLPRLDLVQ